MQVKEPGPAERKPRRQLPPSPAPSRGPRRQASAAVRLDVRRVAEWTAPAPLRRAVWASSLVLLAASIAILLWGIYSALAYTLTHAGAPCSNPPSRDSWPPQRVVVTLCLATYVLGHLTARLQRIDPATTSRHRTSGRADVRRLEPDAYARRNEALFVQALLLIFLLEVAGLLIIETATLANHVWPITYYVRCAYDAAGAQSTFAAAAIMFLVGRWFWLPARRSDAAHPE